MSPDTPVINKVTFYTLYVDRSTDPDGIKIDPVATIAAGSSITIKFPSVFNTSYGYTCSIDNINYACTSVGQNVVMTSYFTTAMAV